MSVDFIVPQGHLRVAPLGALPELLRKLGGNLQPLLVALRLPGDVLDDPNRLLPILTVGELLAQAAEQVKCEHLGLLLGISAGIGQLGAIGQMMRLMPTVGSALDVLQRLIELHDRAGIVSLRRQDGQVGLGYHLFEGGFPGVLHIQDAAIAVGLNIMRALCGRDWVPERMSFAHRAPANAHVYEAFFGCPCQFDSLRTELLFRAEHLQATLHEPCTQEGGEASRRASGSPDWSGRVRNAAYLLLLNGGCSQQLIAAHLQISVRSLNRRLAEEGSSYVEVMDRARFAISRMLLKETELSIKSIAGLVGYTDAASFNRAFRRWTACTPLNWRLERQLRA